MANATLLQIVQRATGEMGLAVPTSVAGNTAADSVQLLALLNGLGGDLVRDHEWQQINRQHIFTVTSTTIQADTTMNSASLTNCSSILGIDGTYQISGPGINQATYITAAGSGATLPLSQVATGSFTQQTYSVGKVKYAMPADWDRQIDRTHWDKSKHWEMLGPETAQQWEWLISGYISTGPRIRYRIFGNYFQIWPLVTTAEQLGFEYLSQNWVLSTAVTDNVPDLSQFTSDTDTCIYKDRLMVTGLKLRYFQAKGFDTAALAEDFNMQYDNAVSTDAGSPILSMATRPSSVLISYANIPDSGFGQ